jgi:hypothetical protein
MQAVVFCAPHRPDASCPCIVRSKRPSFTGNNSLFTSDDAFSSPDAQILLAPARSQKAQFARYPRIIFRILPGT